MIYCNYIRSEAVIGKIKVKLSGLKHCLNSKCEHMILKQEKVLYKNYMTLGYFIKQQNYLELLQYVFNHKMKN